MSVNLISIDWRSVSIKAVDRDVILECDKTNHENLKNMRSVRSTMSSFWSGDRLIGGLNRTIWQSGELFVRSYNGGGVLEGLLIIGDPIERHDFCELYSRELLRNLDDGRDFFFSFCFNEYVVSSMAGTRKIKGMILKPIDDLVTSAYDCVLALLVNGVEKSDSDGSSSESSKYSDPDFPSEAYQAADKETLSTCPQIPVQVLSEKYSKPVSSIAYFDTGTHTTMMNPKVLPLNAWKKSVYHFLATDGQTFITNLVSKNKVGIRIFPTCTLWVRVIGTPLPDKDVLIGWDIYSQAKFLRIEVHYARIYSSIRSQYALCLPPTRILHIRTDWLKVPVYLRFVFI
ncbi:hypothetical protein Ddye_012180 [Dipteronia dyeriana]|uniref:Uncharacterized protein n=1 Tax=Dipteronia dyeriana TaxID=168575 RepID=A0AAD9X3W9_9ROSI|nr:hypothetical protein Ddye_012180 [Dipteronia dyeriana]